VLLALVAVAEAGLQANTVTLMAVAVAVLACMAKVLMARLAEVVGLAVQTAWHVQVGVAIMVEVLVLMPVVLLF